MGIGDWGLGIGDWGFLMAYLIGRRQMTFTQAYELVKSKFNHVEPND